MFGLRQARSGSLRPLAAGAPGRNTKGSEDEMRTPKQWTDHYRRSRAGAEAKRIDYTLSLQDFARTVAQPCLWCGDVLHSHQLYRLDLRAGFVPHNVAASCKECAGLRVGKRQLERLQSAVSAYESVAERVRTATAATNTLNTNERA